ncbi:MAG: hypothetical protein II072_00635 [Clostridia bacterium]|nr:hypothetical protein [Clostridia bacterium]MBR4636617.1 hypothetical protein [Clostridia bacterium]
MRVIRKILSNLHRYVLWLLVSVLLWSWVFTFLNDTTAKRKVMLFVNVPAVDDAALEKALSAELPDGIKMIKVHPFEYAAFLADEADNADMYILSASDLAKNFDRLQVVPEDAFEGRALFTDGGEVYGVCVYDAESGKGAAQSFLDFVDQSGEHLYPNENYYLCFNKKSMHIGVWNDGRDSAAVSIAEKLLTLP